MASFFNAIVDALVMPIVSNLGFAETDAIAVDYESDLSEYTDYSEDGYEDGEGQNGDERSDLDPIDEAVVPDSQGNHAITDHTQRSGNGYVARLVVLEKSAEAPSTTFGISMVGPADVVGNSKLDRVFVQTVVPGSIAEKAGLRKGDKVLRVNGVSAVRKSLSTVLTMVQGQPRVSLEVITDVRGLDLQAAAAEGTNNESIAHSFDQTREITVHRRNGAFGFSLIGQVASGENSTDSFAIYISTIVPGSAAAEAGLHVGDRLVAVDGTSMDTGLDVALNYLKPKQEVILTVYSDAETFSHYLAEFERQTEASVSSEEESTENLAARVRSMLSGRERPPATYTPEAGLSLSDSDGNISKEAKNNNERVLLDNSSSSATQSTGGIHDQTVDIQSSPHLLTPTPFTRATIAPGEDEEDE